MDTQKRNFNSNMNWSGFYQAVVCNLKRIFTWINQFLSFSEDEKTESGINLDSEEGKW